MNESCIPFTHNRAAVARYTEQKGIKPESIESHERINGRFPMSRQFVTTVISQIVTPHPRCLLHTCLFHPNSRRTCGKRKWIHPLFICMHFVFYLNIFLTLCVLFIFLDRSLKALLFMQLPCRPESHHSRVNEKRSKKCLIEISRYRFSLVISGLTKILQRVNELTPSTSSQRPFQLKDQDRQESIIIVLDTLQKCLANTPKDTTKFEEAMNVKLLLREICQFIGERNENC